MFPRRIPTPSERQAQRENWLVDPEDAHLLERAWLDSAGYVCLTVGPRRQQRLHRVLMNPPMGYVVDHINGVKTDNRKTNLRICRQVDNCKNSSARSDSKTGVRGVWFDKRREKWVVQITTEGSRVHVGRFDSMQEAIAARKAREVEMWGEFRRD